MEEISQLDLPEYSGTQEITNVKTELNICVCCLLENVPFVSLSNCNHIEFFECFLKFKLEYQETLVCYGCHKMLKEIYQFKKQVESSIMRLNKQLVNIQPNNWKFSKLSRSNTEIFYSQNSEPIAKEILEPKINFELRTEVKIEHEFSDPEYDIPLSAIKEKKIKIKNDPLIKKYGGKIKSVLLSEEEMWEERRREALKAGYLNLPYKCESCITGFDHELTLKDHLEKRHNKENGAFVCEICKSVLCSDGSFRDHTRRHYRRIECAACGARYSTAHSAAAHYGGAHGRPIGAIFQCRLCAFTTQSYRSLRYHGDKHKQKPRCAVCGNCFVNSGALKVHMFTVHKVSSRVYSCSQCSKVYKARSGLVAHTASAHAGAGAYCAACETHFRTDHNLRHHLNTHSRHTTTDDKKFICSECSERFLTKTQLREHVDWEHRKSTKYKCTQCNKVFKNGTGLKRHTSFVHEKKRPPRSKICDHCGRGFTTMSILRAHIRTHTGERPLRCSHCAATFAHAAALYTHNKLLHTHTRN